MAIRGLLRGWGGGGAVIRTSSASALMRDSTACSTSLLPGRVFSCGGVCGRLGAMRGTYRDHSFCSPSLRGVALSRRGACCCGASGRSISQPRRLLLRPLPMCMPAVSSQHTHTNTKNTTDASHTMKHSWGQLSMVQRYSHMFEGSVGSVLTTKARIASIFAGSAAL
jgi:hypothetical protein